MANLPPPPGTKKSKTSGTGGLPPPPKVGSGSKKSTSGTEVATVRTMFRKYGKGYLPWLNLVVQYSKAYHINAAYVAAVLLTEDPRADPKAKNASGALGMGQIVDGTIGKGINNQPLSYAGPHGQIITVYPGATITDAMKMSPTFALAYVAWRISGSYAKYGWPGAYTKGYNPGYTGNINRFIPNNYVPTQSNAGAGVDPTALANATKGITATANNPFVIYDKKTHSIQYTTQLGNNVMMFEGVPVTRSILQQQTQDKTGLGGDYYNFTGNMPNPKIVASLMASGHPVMQLENHWIQDTQNFKKSPAGKKYAAGYQDAWSQIMGRNSQLPWQLVQEAAQSNLNETEFAAKLRMDGFHAQQKNKQWSYLQSNEYQSKRDAYTLSYQKIYGEHMTDPGMKTLASDAALSGWDPTQWEAYLRSRPEYTSTREYQGHALGILNKLGMDFGGLVGLAQGGYTPPSGADQLPGPPTDKRVNKGKPGTTAGVGNDLGMVAPNA